MKTDIFGVLFDNFTIPEAIQKAIESLDNNKPFVIATPNPEIVEVARKDAEYKTIINSSDIVTPDGIGIVYASKFLKGHIKERAAGFDIVCGIIGELNKRCGSVFLFGSKPGVAEDAAKNLNAEYPDLKISGCRNGYFKDDADIIQEIQNASPDLLLVCLGAPKQEKWIYAHKDELDVNVCMGVGGTMDVLAGTAERAPEFYIKHNIEWLYRLKKQPSRIGRMMDLPKFGFTVLLHGRKFK